MVNGDCRIFSERDRGKELLELAGCDAPRDHAEELAVLSNHLAGDEDFPYAGKAAVHQLDLWLRDLHTRLQRLEISAIVNSDIRNDGGFRRVDQDAVCIVDVDASDLAHPADPFRQLLMYFGHGNPAPEIGGRCNALLMDLLDKIDERDFSIVQLLVEVTGKQGYGIFQLAFAARDRVLAEAANHHRGADRNGADQHDAANDKPENWAAPDRRVAVRQDRIAFADCFFADSQHCSCS